MLMKCREYKIYFVNINILISQYYNIFYNYMPIYLKQHVPYIDSGCKITITNYK